MSRRFVGAAVLSLVLVSSAACADEYDDGQYHVPSGNIPPPYVSLFSWTGFYAGGHFGFSYSDTRFDYTATPLATCAAITGLADDCHASGNTNANSLAGGLQAGFNQQIGHFVWGLEGDVTWRGNDSGKATFLPAFGVVQNFSESDDWLITLRPRVGFSIIARLSMPRAGLLGAASAIPSHFRIRPTCSHP
jgi:outer membrane immunogenic protein